MLTSAASFRTISVWCSSSQTIVRRYPLLQMSSTHRWIRPTPPPRKDEEAPRLLWDLRSGRGVDPARPAGSLSFAFVPPGLPSEPELALVLAVRLTVVGSGSESSAVSAVPLPALVLTRTGLILLDLSSVARLLMLLLFLLLMLFPLDEEFFSSEILALTCLVAEVSLDDLLTDRVFDIPTPVLELLLLIIACLFDFNVSISSSSKSPSEDGLGARTIPVRLLVLVCEGPWLLPTLVLCSLTSAAHCASSRRRDSTRLIDTYCTCQWIDCTSAMLSARLISNSDRHPVS